MNSSSVTIGLLLADLSDGYQSSIWEAVSNYCSSQNVTLLTFSGGALKSPHSWDSQRNPLFDLVSSNQVDGIIGISGPLGNYVEHSELKEFYSRFSDIPIVSIGVPFDNVPSILTDNTHSMQALMEHIIINHGCKRIAFIKGPEKNPEANIRFDIYRRCLEQYNIPYDPMLVAPGDFGISSGPQAIELLVDKRQVTFDAIIGVDDQTSLYAIKALEERNISVPEDVIAAGFDDVEESRYTAIPLTTIHQPLQELGKHAVDTLLKCVEKKEVPLQTYLPAKMVIRRSCGCFSHELNSHTISHADELVSIYSKDIKAHILEDTKNFIIQKMPEIPDENGMYEILEVFFSALLKDIQNKSETNLINKIDMILPRIYRSENDISIWRKTIAMMMSCIISHVTDHETILFIDNLKNNVIDVISEIEIRLQVYKRITFQNQTRELHKISEEFIAVFDLERIKEILHSKLPELGINTCFISLFSYGIQNRRSCSCIFYYDNNIIIEEKECVYPSSRLFPDSFSLESTNLSFVVMPLFFEDSNLGFALFETGNRDPVVYETLSSKLSSVIQGAKLVEQVQKHADNLEAEVKERTKELHVINKKLKNMSLEDPLTKLKNRRYLNEVIIPEAEKFRTDFFLQTKKLNKRPLHVNENELYGLFLVDIDYFKNVNDSYGHVSGDMVLKKIARVFSRLTRSDDVVIRWGGEEFLILLRRTHPNFIPLFAEKLRRTVAKTVFEIEHGNVIHKTCSIGCVTFPLHSNYPEIIDFDIATSLLDDALYYAKENGRNQSVQIMTTDKIIDNIDVIHRALEDLEWATRKGYLQIQVH